MIIPNTTKIRLFIYEPESEETKPPHVDNFFFMTIPAWRVPDTDQLREMDAGNEKEASASGHWEHPWITPVVPFDLSCSVYCYHDPETESFWDYSACVMTGIERAREHLWKAWEDRKSRAA